MQATVNAIVFCPGCRPVATNSSPPINDGLMQSASAIATTATASLAMVTEHRTRLGPYGNDRRNARLMARPPPYGAFAQRPGDHPRPVTLRLGSLRPQTARLTA